MKNPVAKYTRQFNHATIQRDRKNDYNRKQKHRGKDGATRY